jgi:hypothetical protein
MLEDDNLITRKITMRNILNYEIEDDKLTYLYRFTYEIYNFLGRHQDYSDVNVMVEVLERLAFLNYSFDEKPYLNEILKQLFDRFTRFITKFTVEYLERLFKVIQYLGLKPIRDTLNKKEIEALLRIFIKDVALAVDHCERLRDPRVQFYLQYFISNDSHKDKSISFDVSMVDLKCSVLTVSFAEELLQIANDSAFEIKGEAKAIAAVSVVLPETKPLFKKDNTGNLMVRREVNEPIDFKDIEVVGKLGMDDEEVALMAECDRAIEQMNSKMKKYNEKMFSDDEFENKFIKANNIDRYRVEEKITEAIKSMNIKSNTNEITKLFSNFFTNHKTFTIGSYCNNYHHTGLNLREKSVDLLITKVMADVEDCNNSKRIKHYINKFNNPDKNPDNKDKYQLAFQKEVPADNNNPGVNITEFYCRLIDNVKNTALALRFIFYRPDYEETNVIIKELNSPVVIFVHRFLQDLLFKSMGGFIKTRYQISVIIMAYMDHRFNIFKKNCKKVIGEDNAFYYEINNATKDLIKKEELGYVILDITRYVINFLVYIKERSNGKTNNLGCAGFDKLVETFEKHERYLFSSAYLFNLKFLSSEIIDNRNHTELIEYNKNLKLLQGFYFVLWEYWEKFDDYSKVLMILDSKFKY